MSQPYDFSLPPGTVPVEFIKEPSNFCDELPRSASNGDVFVTKDGSIWYYEKDGSWSEHYDDQFYGHTPTGKKINTKDQSGTCSYSSHKWKLYESIISVRSNFEYCEVCDEKKSSGAY